MTQIDTHYMIPDVDIIEVEVERGFAESPGGGSTHGGFSANDDNSDEYWKQYEEDIIK